jgi:hypothetical protein
MLSMRNLTQGGRSRFRALLLAFITVCLTCLGRVPSLCSQESSSSSPAFANSPAPTGMDLRWYDPVHRNQAAKQQRIEFGQKQKDVNATLGISECEREVCFLSLPLQAGWFADFGPELTGVFPVVVHFSEEGLYHIETTFPSSFFDDLEPKLSERYGATVFRNSSTERDQEVREWQAGGVRIRLVKAWHYGNREEGSLSLSLEKGRPQLPAKEKLPF